MREVEKDTAQQRESEDRKTKQQTVEQQVSAAVSVIDILFVRAFEKEIHCQRKNVADKYPRSLFLLPAGVLVLP